MGLTSLLLGVFGLGAIACLPQSTPTSFDELSPDQSSPGQPPVLSSPENRSPTESIVNILVGEWQLVDAPTHNTQSMSLIFSADNQLIVRDASMAEQELESVGIYSITTQTTPMQMDIVFQDEAQSVQTIFIVTSTGQLHLQDNQPGAIRPTQFDDNVAILEKVSDAPEVPSSGHHTTFDQDTTEEGDMAIAYASEAKQMVGTVNRAQQIYYLENQQFSQAIADLGIGINTDSEHYHYDITTQMGGRLAVTTARPKHSGLNSYTGAVTVLFDQGEGRTIALLCESNQPTTIAPRITGMGATIACGSGARPLI